MLSAKSPEYEWKAREETSCKTVGEAAEQGIKNVALPAAWRPAKRGDGASQDYGSTTRLIGNQLARGQLTIAKRTAGLGRFERRRACTAPHKRREACRVAP